jgi:hypothetical protein
LVFTLKEYGALVSVDTRTLSTSRSTALTPTLSLADTVTLILAETAVPAPGDVMAAVGGAVSAVVLLTLTEDVAEAVFPSVSLATAISEWEQLLSAVVLRLHA